MGRNFKRDGLLSVHRNGATITLRDLALATRIPYGVLYARYKKGDQDEHLTRPVVPQRISQITRRP